MPTQLEVYDLETGEVLERFAPVAREMEKFSRYTRNKPANWEQIAAEGRKRLAESKEGQAQPTVPTPTGNVWVGMVADAIEKLDPETDFNRDGTPDRRKLAGVLHVNSVSKEDALAALRLLGRAVGADVEPDPNAGEGRGEE